MKKILFTAFMICIAIGQSLIPSVFAATPTPSLSPSPSASATPSTIKSEDQVNQVNKLKEQVESFVEKQNLVEKRGIIVKVTRTTNTQIIGDDINGDSRLIDVDEFTEFSSPSNKSFGISDIKTGDTLSVLGLYNKNSERILARFIDQVSLERFVYATISEINKSDYSIVISNKNLSPTVDIETTTKTFSFSKEDGLEKAGFSDLTEGQKVFVFGFNDKNNEDRIIASKIIIINIFGQDEIPTSSPSAATKSATTN